MAPPPPQPLITYEIPAPGIPVDRAVYRIEPPNNCVWDIVRVYAVASSVRSFVQANFNGSPGPPGSTGGIRDAYGGLYKDIFDKSNEIAMFSYFTQQKQFVELQQVYRIGYGESVLAVSTVASSALNASGLVFGIQVFEFEDYH